MGCINCIKDATKPNCITNRSLNNQIPENIANYFTFQSPQNVHPKPLTLKMSLTQDTADKNKNTLNVSTTIQSFPLNIQNQPSFHKEAYSISSYDSEIHSSNSIVKKTSQILDSKLFIDLYRTVSVSQEEMKQPFEKLTFYKNIMFDSNGKIINKENKKIISYSFGNNTSVHINTTSDCEDKKEKQTNINTKTKELDYIIQDKTILPHQFDIEYIAKNGSFHLKDVSTGSGVFYRLQTKEVLPEEGKFIFTFSDFYFKVKTEINENQHSLLTLTFIEEEHSHQEFIFNSSETPNFKIGRGLDCEISIPSSEVSRVQLTFIYDNNVWTIYDGSIEENMKQIPSTNGTWIQVNESIKLTHGLVLKTGQVIMDVKIQ